MSYYQEEEEEEEVEQDYNDGGEYEDRGVLEEVIDEVRGYDDDRYVERDERQVDYDEGRFVQPNDQERGYGGSRSIQSGYQERDLDNGRFQEGPYVGRQADFTDAPPPGPPPGHMQGPRKKSLLIGINYEGSQHQLEGCHQDVTNMRQFLGAMGYASDQRSQVVMRDDQSTDRNSPYFPYGHNILAAMKWLVSEPNTVNFLHYSGHGGQVASDDYRASGFDDTIVPFDFESNGQIPSGILHRTLVTMLPPNSTLFVVFDCCHSGSAIELPYIYRTDENGNIGLLNNVQTGMRLVGEASHLIQGGFTVDKVGEAETLLAGATDFFKGLTHQQSQSDQYGLGKQEFADEYQNEGMRNVWMYSGCRDDQTSADASIQGSHVGAMSWAFLQSMKQFGAEQSYVQVLQNTRQILAGRYSQVPQLSVGYEQDLNYKIRI